MPQTPGLELDALGRVPLAEGMKRLIDAELASLPKGKRGALVVIADERGGRAHLAARFGEHWKVAGGIGVPWNEPRPSGWAGVEFAW